jgi:hypothetical protein
MTAPDNPRDLLGLTAAEDGDVFGALRFVEFMQRESLALASTSELPGPICDRLLKIGRDMQVIAAFMEGYAAAHSFRPHTDEDDPQ